MLQTHQLVASHTCPDRDRACNQGACPCSDSNPGPFNPWADTLTAEPNQPGPIELFKNLNSTQSNPSLHHKKYASQSEQRVSQAKPGVSREGLGHGQNTLEVCDLAVFPASAKCTT